MVALDGDRLVAIYDRQLPIPIPSHRRRDRNAPTAATPLAMRAIQSAIRVLRRDRPSRALFA
jgi:hypothetical protein